MFEGGDLNGIGILVAGEESVQPFGEIRLQSMALLPVQLRPAGRKEFAELWVDAQEIRMLPFLVIELVDQGAYVGITFAHDGSFDLDIDFQCSGSQTSKRILEPFPRGFPWLSSYGGEKRLGGELQV